MRVFKVFEEENLRDLLPTQAKLASRLLRVIALFAPVNIADRFSEKVAVALTTNILDVEDEIQRLRRVQLLTESRDETASSPICLQTSSLITWRSMRRTDSQLSWMPCDRNSPTRSRRCSAIWRRPRGLAVRRRAMWMRCSRHSWAWNLNGSAD